MLKKLLNYSKKRTIITRWISFLSDLVGNPSLLNKVGKLIASIYMEEDLDAVVTIATKGISLANAVANVLNLPVVVIEKTIKLLRDLLYRLTTCLALLVRSKRWCFSKH